MSEEPVSSSTQLGLAISRQQVEDFLYHEAGLLDEWRLDEWLELLTEDARYCVPSTDIPDHDDPRTGLFLIADDMERLRSRAKQLNTRFARAEYPHARTRRAITNVRILGTDGDTINVTANFIVSRIRLEVMENFVGRYEYKLVFEHGRLKIRERRAILDLDVLRPQGKLSFIL
jgi:p-cumate 2,3-dioxygenase beta subunit